MQRPSMTRRKVSRKLWHNTHPKCRAKLWDLIRVRKSLLGCHQSTSPKQLLHKTAHHGAIHLVEVAGPLHGQAANMRQCIASRAFCQHHAIVSSGTLLAHDLKLQLSCAHMLFCMNYLRYRSMKVVTAKYELDFMFDIINERLCKLQVATYSHSLKNRYLFFITNSIG